MTASVPVQKPEGRELLMIFARNAEKGKVKTRLAKSIGDEGALRVYLELMEHTARSVHSLGLDREVHYTDSIHGEDPLNKAHFSKKLQSEGDLGERMARAFQNAFDRGYERVIIIGTDCYELRKFHLEEAFQALRYSQDAVLGPASDGGYYLLGMNRYIDALFRNKQWGGENVLLDTLVDLRSEALSYHLLPTLNDVDEEKDIGDLRRSIEQ